jgi:hypothetical protein
VQVDSQHADALTVQDGEHQQHRQRRALLATAAASGELFDLVESKDSSRKDAQQAVSDSGSGQRFQNRWQRREAAQRTLRELKKHEERLVGKNKPRKQDVHYQAIVHNADPASDEEDANGTAPEHVPAEIRQLSRQNAFRDGRRQENLVEKAREAYDSTGGGLAGMQVLATASLAFGTPTVPSCRPEAASALAENVRAGALSCVEVHEDPRGELCSVMLDSLCWASQASLLLLCRKRAGS